MIAREQFRLVRLRTLMAALILLIGAVSAPISLAAQTADACGMACCIREGFCCCNPHHASVKRQASDGKPRISEFILTASCPEGCAVGVRSSKLPFRSHLRNGAPQTLGDEPQPIFPEPVIAVHSSIESGSFPPRAPPIPSTT